MIVAATGHRPNKLGGYGKEAFDKLYNLAFKWLKKNKPAKCISGMALGWDQAFAKATLDLNIKLVAAIPCKDQYKLWSYTQRNVYNRILKNKLCTKKVINDIPYQMWVMQKRNEWMVEHCDKILAVWDGSDGGTANCIRYANKLEVEVINLYDQL